MPDSTSGRGTLSITRIAFTGSRDLVAAGVFLGLFVVVLLAFERFVQ